MDRQLLLDACGPFLAHVDRRGTIPVADLSAEHLDTLRVVVSRGLVVFGCRDGDEWCILLAPPDEAVEISGACVVLTDAGREGVAEWRLTRGTASGQNDDGEKRPTTAQPSRHSPDFRSVHWFGTVYSFTANQAAVVKLLWAAWENGTPEVSGDYLLETADLQGARLRDVFRHEKEPHPAWGTMIRPGGTKGAFRLVEPTDSEKLSVPQENPPAYPRYAPGGAIQCRRWPTTPPPPEDLT